MFVLMKHSLLICLLLVAVLITSGCKNTPARPALQEEVLVMAADIEMTTAPEVADPEGAIDAIYASLDSYIAKDLNLAQLKDVIGLMELRAEKVYARYSEPKGGLADVVIIKPRKTYEVEVREALYRYIDRRVSEFEFFDVLGSYDIAQNAIIFEQGEYIVMLMLADNEAAQTILNQYMPF